MPYTVHPMRRDNISQVAEIDREAFSGQWPPPNYHQEIQNQLAHFIVACDESRTAEEPANDRTSLLSRIRGWFSRDHLPSQAAAPSIKKEYVIGFSGIWLMADEAHITAIAARKEYQGRGIGELLLMHTIELTRQLKADILTLEVRVSNYTAQSLYKKYGFKQVGIRRFYYTDNREDAMLMSTESLTSPEFLAKFEELQKSHHRKWGETIYRRSKEYPAQLDTR